MSFRHNKNFPSFSKTFERKLDISKPSHANNPFERKLDIIKTSHANNPSVRKAMQNDHFFKNRPSFDPKNLVNIVFGRK
jgi:hypothetical protein